MKFCSEGSWVNSHIHTHTHGYHTHTHKSTYQTYQHLHTHTHTRLLKCVGMQLKSVIIGIYVSLRLLPLHTHVSISTGNIDLCLHFNRIYTICDLVDMPQFKINCCGRFKWDFIVKHIGVEI